MTRRDRIVIVVIVAVAALGAFWMLALGPKRDEAAKLGNDLDAAHQRLDQARAELVAGDAARSGYAANYAAVARLGKAVPSEDDVPSLVFQLDSTAKSTGVDFRSVKLTSNSSSTPPATSAAGATAGAGNKTAPSGQGGSPSSSSPPSPSGSGATATTPTPSAPSPAPNPATPASATQTATATLPPGATVGPAGLSTMPFSFKFAGSFFRLDGFLLRLERYITPRRDVIDVSGRLLVINGIALTAGSGGFPHMQASIAATAYLVPPDQGTFNGATP
ncbi:MAG: hypothetical protein M3155_04765, partial [Actinomycetota bacterium]|nr:hypothetical protein [Actinomycetota bacterium]